MGMNSKVWSEEHKDFIDPRNPPKPVATINREVLARALNAEFNINAGLPLGEWEAQSVEQRKRWFSKADKIIARLNGS